MSFRFSAKKIIQASCVLLESARQHRMSYLRLLKLLYVADRESLKQWHRPIIGTRLVAMKNGPLHSEVFNLINGEHSKAPIWAQHIRRDRCDVTLLKAAGVSELSPAEVRTLKETFEQFDGMDDWELVETVHEFAEWSKNYPDKSADTSHTIPFEDMIEGAGLSNEKAAILEEEREDHQIDQMIASCRQR